MQNTISHPRGNDDAMTAAPRQQEIYVHIRQARRTQSAYLHDLVAGTFATLGRLAAVSPIGSTSSPATREMQNGRA